MLPAAEPLQLRLLGIEPLQRLVGDGQDLGRLKAGGGIQGHESSGKLADHGLIGGDTGILVALALGIVGKLGAADLDVLQQLHIGKQGPGVPAQSARIGGHLLALGDHVLKFLLPKLVAGVQVLGGPAVTQGDVVSALKSFAVHIVPPNYYFGRRMWKNMRFAFAPFSREIPQLRDTHPPIANLPRPEGRFGRRSGGPRPSKLYFYPL